MEVKEEEDNLEKEGEGRNKRRRGGIRGRRRRKISTQRKTPIRKLLFECPKLLKSYLSTLVSLFLIQNFFKNS